MERAKIPKLRVLATDFCDSKCVYCRPGGEGNLKCRKQSLDFEIAKDVAKAYRNLGGNSIKITGGDPVFWSHLIEYVKYLKEELNYSCVEVISRSVHISEILNELKNSGLDILNFSLDTIYEEKYSLITRKNDFNKYKEIICECANNFYCKINMVILPETTIKDIDEMINFCIENGIRELKLLDYIDDLNNDSSEKINQKPLFKKIYNKLSHMSKRESVEFQGGLGHPMNVYYLSERFKVICKDASQGAWYCKKCLGCKRYPCHDALMALRVTPSNSFQLCLLNEKMHWNFNNANMCKQLDSIIENYQNAFFIGDNNEDNCVNPS